MKGARVVLIFALVSAAFAASMGRVGGEPVSSPVAARPALPIEEVTLLNAADDADASRSAENTNAVASEALSGTSAPVSTNEPAKVFHHIPKESQKFSIWKKLNPIWWFGNADDPVPSPNYRKGKCFRTFTWYMRNPFHNFSHYVIGIGDKHFTRVGRFPDKVENPNGGWNWAVCRYRFWRLPFVDYQRGRFEFYLGWRNGGNFGMKLNFAQKRATTPKPQKSGAC